MDAVNKTLYIPLYGKAFVSKKGLFLADQKAEKIWEAEGFRLKGNAGSKWLAYYMGIRAAVFDEWVRRQLEQDRAAVVLHIGCGMDSRVLRVGTGNHQWYDVDFPEVIDERKRYYCETKNYQMFSGDVRHGEWLKGISETDCAVVVMEGVSMYLTSGELRAFTENLCAHFRRVVLLMDCYTVMAARLSKYKNPVRNVGVTQVYGTDDPLQLQGKAFMFVKEHAMTPEKYVEQLHGMERHIFEKLYAGSFSKKLYRLFEYRKM